MKLYVVLLDALTGGHIAAQCAHAVAEIHATDPASCAAWRASTNTVVVLQAPG